MPALIEQIRSLFPGLNNTIYFNTATMCVGCTPAREAYERAAERWSAGRFDWLEAERAGDDARGIFASIIGARAEEIAIVPAVSAAAGLVAANLPPAKRGENIVVAETEFSSNYFPWLLLRDRGYEVRTVRPHDDALPPATYADAADGGTRLIAVSAVQSSTGYRVDLAAMSRVAASSGAWLFVDACQAAGAVPVDVMRDGVDFLAAASHKFLLGSRGMGYLYVRHELVDAMRPVWPGWKAGQTPMQSFYGPKMELSSTASKLDMSLAWFPARADQAALGVFRTFGITPLLERNAALSQRLYDALVVHGMGTHLFDEAQRSTIFSIPVADTERAMVALKDAGVVASVRAGRVRLAAHFYNREQEIDRVVELLSAV